MEEVAVFLVPISFFAAIVWIVKIISDNRIRRKVLDQRVSDEVAQAVMMQDRRHAPSRLGALKWGLIIGALGLSFVLIEIMSIDTDEPLAYGLLFIGAGAGLVIYYLMVDDDMVGDDEEEQPPKAAAESDAVDFDDLP